MGGSRRLQEHVSAEDLAAFAEARTDAVGDDRIQDHLSRCRSCFAAYEEAVRVRLESTLDPASFAPDPVLVAIGCALPRRAPVVEPEPNARGPRRFAIGGSLARLRVFPVLGIGAAAVLAVLMLAPLSGDEDTDAFAELIDPIRSSMAVTSTRGLAYPRVEASNAGDPERLRSGGAANLDEVLDALFDRYDRGPRSPRTTFWLAAGLIESGQLRAARQILDAASAHFPDDVDFAILQAIVAYRDDRLERARDILEDVVRIAPHDEIALRNLERVRRELQ